MLSKGADINTKDASGFKVNHLISLIICELFMIHFSSKLFSIFFKIFYFYCEILDLSFVSYAIEHIH